eukprot:CAMPEP_0197276736 /NCGR_PEP_ID=MMETSP1432-20130617/15864_1 /TAXON_ID=44447 /ORGANISM="Pseudo-nitzschia delicatissima, Strain UNC1205" /LENGTH=187 /DNA_ID=CAMNT_0042742829 /DNA_START=29 /DNA_END=592 /DNA_ORIENTATION=-
MVLQYCTLRLVWGYLAMLLLVFGTHGTDRMAKGFRSPITNHRNPSSILSRQPHSGASTDVAPRFHTSTATTTSLSCGLLEAIQNALGGNNSEATKATASHILTQNKAQLEKLRAEIEDNPFKFGEAAAQYSDCSSASVGGDLGEFGKGQMAKEFEKVVFDPKTPIGVVQGPISTEFGYHLILVKERS